MIWKPQQPRMESSTSVRRRAWINSSRQRLTAEDTDTQFPSITDDDVFSSGQDNSPGCYTGKIENWFLTCRSLSSEIFDQSFDLPLQTRFKDDSLNLGDDADAINNYHTHFVGFAQHQLRRERSNRLTSGAACQRLFLPAQRLGQNSFNSSSTWNSSTSVAEVLHIYSENAEETLYELGFGCDDLQVTARIPSRFLNFPSQAKGVNFRLFLDAQLQRIREDDPSLTLASRFRQVQVLTEMANAFYSLYSHVSRTPVQKLPAPEFNFFTPIERMERFRSSIPCDPRSPVDKLKDTVSKMCLYTGSNRESNSALLSPNKCVSLPDIVDIVLEKPRCIIARDIGTGDLITAMDACDDNQGYHNINSMQHPTSTQEDDQNLENTNNALLLSGQAGMFQNEAFTNSGRSCEPESSICAIDPEPLIRTSYEYICPQIVECVHQAPFYSQYGHLKTMLSSTVSTVSVINPLEKSQELSSSFVKSKQSCNCLTVRSKSDNLLSPAMACKKTEHCANHQYLAPVPNIGKVNSFELEEVHSAGEEDLGQAKTSPLSSVCKYTGEIVRGDSVQSDSSGYADDVSTEHQS